MSFLSLPLSLSGVFRSRFAYIWAIRSVQLCLFILSGVTAFLLRFEFSIPPAMHSVLLTGISASVACKVATFQVFGMGRGMWRYFATPDLVRVTKANACASALAWLAVSQLVPARFPRSVLVIDFLLSLIFTAGIRAATRWFLEAGCRARLIEQRRAFVYGAGAAGSTLLSESRSNASFAHQICGLIDDDPDKRGMLVNGVPVRGAGTDLAKLVANHRVSEVLIAIPSATGAQMNRILEHCHQAGVSFRTMPAISEMVAERGISGQIREVAVEDILGRNPVHLDTSGIRAKIHGKVVLVTGAAGSIGSELCRQIARFEPASLVALDISETALFHLQYEIRHRFPELQFYAEIGSIQNRQRMRDVFRLRGPSVVYHAAAYKHVPLMEAHAFEAVENNIFGTYNLATVTAEFGAEDFVMISSDKAVRPTNIMGATKRVAELIVRSLQNGGPRYVSVRFGNVLGSSGSVVPIFKKQIAAGGPVTVTHPDMRRYFMTIPEASQLVLQASTMGTGGEIFVLDMGSPVRIVELARQLILLSGLTPGADIRIEFTGLRPGEKLYEELNLIDEQTVPTGHEKIKAFSGACLPFEQAIRHISVLRNACESRDLRALIWELKELAPDYNPSGELLHQISQPGLVRLADAVGADERIPEPNLSRPAVIVP